MKLSEKGRRLLRMIYRGLGITALVSACGWPEDRMPAPEYGIPPAPMYGPPPPFTIQGTVLSEGTEAPIPGIKVSVKNQSVLTDKNGIFIIPVPWSDEYTFTFEDIDGAQNGFFKQKSETLTQTDINNTITIFLQEEEDNEE